MGQSGPAHPSLECTMGALLGPWGQSPGLRPCRGGRQQRHLTPQKGQVVLQVWELDCMEPFRAPICSWQGPACVSQAHALNFYSFKKKSHSVVPSLTNKGDTYQPPSQESRGFCPLTLSSIFSLLSKQNSSGSPSCLLRLRSGTRGRDDLCGPEIPRVAALNERQTSATREKSVAEASGLLGPHKWNVCP